MPLCIGMRHTERPSYPDFDSASYGWTAGVDYRAHPELYRVGKGEQGVLICEPYKSEILPHWRFKTIEAANESADKIHGLFLDYLENGDFVGADMARKFLQMGFTRARRYANYKGGRKYDRQDDYSLNEKGTGDPEKAEAAAVFYSWWRKAEDHPDYKAQKTEWRALYG